MKKLSEELSERGFVSQFTNEDLGEIIDVTKRTVYHGIDPSADSAHAGNLVIWLLLRHLANNGHKIIFLVGGGTGMIGDPKPDSERVLQDESITDTNVEKIKIQAQQLIGGDENEITFVNNKDWLIKEGMVSFLRNIGKHFTVNELIKKDAIAKRLESEAGISYTEFAYPLLQAFDYLTLHREYGCDLQVGGSDQWGNIVAGVDLIRRKEKNTVHALTVPLVIDKVTGKKFGKSEGNAIWLDAEKTSPFVFYQFWLNVADENAIDYLKLFTFLSLEEIKELEKNWQMNPENRLAQKTLAWEMTKFVHTEEVAAAVVNVSNVLFGEADLTAMSKVERQILKDNAPILKIAAGTDVLDVLVASELSSSKREARTFIESGAISINGIKLDKSDFKLNGTTEEIFLIKRGKKRVVLVELI